MNIFIPEFSLVLLIGIAASGKSSFAKKHFKETQIISSDFCRKLICDDENDQSFSSQAFELLYDIADKRLENKKLTVIDATNLESSSRQYLKGLAKKHHVHMVALVFNLPKEACYKRNNQRSRVVPEDIIDEQYAMLQVVLKQLATEKYRDIYFLENEHEVENAKLTFKKLACNQKDFHGPFDIIGDIHGCYDELLELLQKLGYHIQTDFIESNKAAITHPQNQTLIFVGDLVDRGPKSKQVLSLVMNAVNYGHALCVRGNHEDKFLRYLKGKNVQLSHGLEVTASEYPKPNEVTYAQTIEFIKKLGSHYVLDGGKLVVAHAGLKEALQERESGKVLSFALYGDTTGEVDEMGLPVRKDWAELYQGKATVVYGHTPVVEAEWINNTICIDTGCVFGGKLTALRYPQMQLVSVVARKSYYGHR
jgi:protein phosphatase